MLIDKDRVIYYHAQELETIGVLGQEFNAETFGKILDYSVKMSAAGAASFEIGRLMIALFADGNALIANKLIEYARKINARQISAINKVSAQLHGEYLMLMSLEKQREDTREQRIKQACAPITAKYDAKENKLELNFGRRIMKAGDNETLVKQLELRRRVARYTLREFKHEAFHTAYKQVIDETTREFDLQTKKEDYEARRYTDSLDLARTKRAKRVSELLDYVNSLP